MSTDLADLVGTDDWEAVLTDSERRLVEHAARGQPLDLRTGNPSRDAVDQAETWDNSRVMRGRVLEALLLRQRSDWPVHRRGVHVAGARIEGEVSLDNGTVDAPLWLDRCAFTERMSMRGANLQLVAFVGTRIPGLTAEYANIASTMILRGGFTSTDEVTLLGARIGGQLICDGGSFTARHGAALVADWMEVGNGIFLSDRFAATGEVSLLGAKVGGQLNCSGGSFTNADGHALTADGIDVRGNIFLSQGFTAAGQVRVPGAKITGQLNCVDGSFTNADGIALNVGGADVGGIILLSDGFAATGEVRLSGAKVGGQLNCSGGSFTNAEGYALVADGVDVGGSMLLSEGFEATGQVHLPRARITDHLSCKGGSFTNAQGSALVADGVDVGGYIFLSEGFEAAGQVRLVRAKVDGQLCCNGGSFSNADGTALLADLGEIGGDVQLSEGFTADGRTSLAGAKIGGLLSVVNGTLTSSDDYALFADRVEVTMHTILKGRFAGHVRMVGAKIGGQLHCNGGSFINVGSDALTLQSVIADSLLLVGATFCGTINVEAASVRLLVDDVDGWPDGWQGGGFAFRDFAGPASDDVSDRLSWLSRQRGDFRPGPYSHLATVYRRRGDPEAARRVLVEREHRRTDRLSGWRQRLRRGWGLLSAYGYQPSRAVLALLGLILIGGVVFAIAPMDIVVEEPLPLLSALYAADLALPLVDFGLVRDWQPTSGWAVAWMWLTIGVGWFLSLAFVAAVTGIFKPDE